MFPKNEQGKRLRDWRDLEQYGIEPLTGESCGIGIRLLCDLSPDGVALMEEFLSVSLDGTGNNSWNHSGIEGWKSIMLPRSMFQQLAAFCLLLEGFTWAVAVNWRSEFASAFYVEGIPDDEAMEQFRDAANQVYEGQWHCWRNNGTAGLRNLHQFSGRVK